MTAKTLFAVKPTSHQRTAGRVIIRATARVWLVASAPPSWRMSQSSFRIELGTCRPGLLTTSINHNESQRGVFPMWYQVKDNYAADKVSDYPKNQAKEHGSRYTECIVHRRTSYRTASTRSNVFILVLSPHHRIIQPRQERRSANEPDTNDYPVGWFAKGRLLGV